MPKIPYRAKHYANVLNIEQPVTFDPYRKRVHHTATKEAGIAAMLQKLMIHDDYENALKLYKILLQSSRYHIANMWEMGVELIGTVEPKLLTDFLQGVFLSAPNKLRVTVFNAYIENLMLEERWREALDELELRCHRPKYHIPMLLEKLKICKQKMKGKYSLTEEKKEEDEEEY
ncbi:hypothetical protein G6F46_010799 [Rhizopus delemar]|nr:hypothetical protein G6F55_001758 [Rhizopus delemar]KAG1554267.1 hypothetical protein G6F51_000067 [Rhizopus arrhizus]KAG1501769.1 hypothetical protein G6F54_002807 [Rhizopus delemar]KAG1503713.1 hypothetical protein G6F53_010564 [Rhizopus delemar]KAG1528328.1 hypothetical protein G6F52_000734 [Rhizopus delemar]